MAQKRMFSKDVVRTDRFLDMSLSAQALYFHLCLDADVHGFITPRSVMRLINATNGDLNTLILKGFVIPFESGVVVVRDWRVHNYIQEDREATSQYKEEYSTLMLTPQGNYKLLEDSESTLKQIRLDEIRLDEIRGESSPSLEEKSFNTRKSITEAVLKEISDDYGVPYEFVLDCWDSAQNWLDAKGKLQKDYKAFLKNWVKKERADFIYKSKKLQGSARKGGVVDARR